MDSIVRSRPTHYERLGLKPGASRDEIARAFAREVGRPRAFGGLADISVAYETLRDPAKRRAYDESLGLGPKPQPRYVPTASWGGMRFVSATPVQPLQRPIGPVQRPVHDEVPAAAAPVSPPREPQVEPPTEERTASFIAASLREPASVAAEPTSFPAPQLKPELPPIPAALAAPRLERRADDATLGAVEDGAIEWKRAGLAVGGLVLTVALFGAWAGWQASNDIEPQQPPERTLKVALPPASAPTTALAPSAPTARSYGQARVERRRRAAVAAAPAIASASPSRPVLRETTLSDESQSFAGQSESGATEQAAAEPAAVETRASMPLANATIAGTIHRIGYSCGKVASTSAVGSGVFKVTCTSGASYQASPRHGRYRFRRLSGN